MSYTIEYDIYYKDGDARNKSKCQSVFPTFSNIGDFLCENAVDSPYGKGLRCFYWPTNPDDTREAWLAEDGLKSFNYDTEKTITIHSIKNELGYYYSDGKYTNGQKFANKDVYNFFKQLQKQYNEPTFKFIKDKVDDMIKDDDNSIFNNFPMFNDKEQLRVLIDESQKLLDKINDKLMPIFMVNEGPNYDFRTFIFNTYTELAKHNVNMKDQLEFLNNKDKKNKLSR